MEESKSYGQIAYEALVAATMAAGLGTGETWDELSDIEKTIAQAMAVAAINAFAKDIDHEMPNG